jgi:hypothetical protein
MPATERSQTDALERRNLVPHKTGRNNLGTVREYGAEKELNLRRRKEKKTGENYAIRSFVTYSYSP